LGRSPDLLKVLRLVRKVACHRHPVLIMGETGTGKELVARAIHTQSPLKDKPFIPIDCGALSPYLVESELFGHTRGAFTGAFQARTGLLAAAGRGTVFLDEVAELTLTVQSKLFRALQEYEIRPVGSNAPRYFEARIIAATTLDLEEAVNRDVFRKELYFRLNVITVKLPPLRERTNDIPVLVEHFLEVHGDRERGVPKLSPEVGELLMDYHWPGNVRELENCIKRALVVCSGPLIKASDLPPNIRMGSEHRDAEHRVTPLKELEQRAIMNALRVTRGDCVRAAKLLGIGKTTIYRKIKELGLANGLSPLSNDLRKENS